MYQSDNPTFSVEMSYRKVRGVVRVGTRVFSENVSVTIRLLSTVLNSSEKVHMKENVFMNTQYQHISSSIGVSEWVGYQP